MILHIKGGIFLAEGISGVRVTLYKEKWGVIVYLKDQSPAFIECESEEEAWNAMNTFEKNWQQALEEEQVTMKEILTAARETRLKVYAAETTMALLQKDVNAINKTMKSIQKQFREVDVLPVPIKYDPDRILTITQDSPDDLQRNEFHGDQ